MFNLQYLIEGQIKHNDNWATSFLFRLEFNTTQNPSNFLMCDYVLGVENLSEAFGSDKHIKLDKETYLTFSRILNSNPGLGVYYILKRYLSELIIMCRGKLRFCYQESSLITLFLTLRQNDEEKV